MWPTITRSLRPCSKFLRERIVVQASYSKRQTHNEPDIIPVALFGAGRLGRIHLKNALSDPRCVVRYVVDANNDVFDKLVTEHPELTSNRHQCNFLTDEDVAATDQNIRAAIICTPTSEHERQICKVLGAGKHVMCEKPISDNVPSIERCYELAEKNDLYLFCAFKKRFDPSIAEAMAFVKEGKLGKVHMVKTVGIDPHLPPPGFLANAGDMFQDFMIHDFDLTCHIVNEKPDYVHGMGKSHIQEIADQKQWDTIVATMQFPSGAIAIMQNGRYASYGYDIRVEIFGEKGMIQVENVHNNLNCYFDSTGEHRTRIGDRDFYLYRYNEAFKMEMTHFLNFIQGKEGRAVFKEDSIQACSLANAAYQSACSNVLMKIE